MLGGLGRTGTGGQVLVEAVAHAQAALLDDAGVGVGRIRGDLVDSLFLVGAAHIAKSNQVFLVQEQNGLALNGLIAAVVQGQIAQGFLVDDAFLGAVQRGVNGAHELAGFKRIGHNDGCFLAQAEQGLSAALGEVVHGGLLLGLLADLAQNRLRLGRDVDVVIGGLFGGGGSTSV